MIEKLVLIDGHAILHRAFHALPPLTTSKGQPTGAVFGFCSMLLRVIQDLKPKYLTVAFDLPVPTFRQEIFPAYQAQRPPMAEELASQVDLLHKVLRVMEIPIFEKEGYEADDLIGTIARQASKDIKKLRNEDIFATAKTQAVRRSIKKEKKKAPNILISQYPNIETIIVTGDRDMLQLVGERVKVLSPVVGISKMVLYDEKAVEEKYGLKPSQWVDFKSLVGDPSDNYPGVAGIGPKTASDLLKKFSSLERIYQSLEKLPEKQAEVLRQGRKQVELARQLAAIAIDIPIKFDLEKCRLKDLKNPKVEKLFEELEFKSLWERLVKNNKTEEKKKDIDNQLSFLN